MKLKRISKKVASEQYGVLTNGVNSLYSYYLREDGCVVDSGGDIRYYPPDYLSEESAKVFVPEDMPGHITLDTFPDTDDDYSEPECGFKFDESKVYCVLCGSTVGHKHGNSYYLSSESEGDEKKGYCHTCVVEHCLATNCLGCDWYQYPSCPHIETKKLYQESTAKK